MKTSEILKSMETIQNGAFFKAKWESDLPLTAAAKKAGVTATKTCTAVCRKGIQYSHQRSVIDKVENGYQLQHDLPWGKWKEGHEGLIIEHKDNDYVRLYLGPQKVETEYSLNGKVATKEELQVSGYIQASWFNKPSEKPECMTVKVDNIRKIGK